MAAPGRSNTPPPPSGPSGPGGPTIGDELSQVTKGVSDFASALAKATGGIDNAVDLAKSSVAVYIESAAFKTLDAAIETYRTRVKSQEDADRQTMLTSALLERVTGMNAAARAQALKDLGEDSLIGIASKKTFEAVNAYSESTITLLDGTQLRSALVFGDINQLFEEFNESVLNDVRLNAAATKGITYDLVENTKLATKSLGISQAGINEIFQKELSETGKITGEALKEVEKSIITTSNVTGVSVALIAKDIEKMTSDFGHFGMMTTDQMGSLSANLKSLGMSINDVTRLADNFSSFDKAASTMSNLAATTGATLDTLELFRLANTDQEEFIRSLREQLESQGVEFENLNFIQQKQISSAFGLDPRVMQRLLNDNIEMMDNVSDQISGRKEDMTDDKLRMSLASLSSLREEIDKTDTKTLALRLASLKSASEDVAVSLEKSYRNTLQLTDAGVATLGGGLDALVTKSEKMREALVKGGQLALEDLSRSNPELSKRYDKLGKDLAADMSAGIKASREAGRQAGYIFGIAVGEGAKKGLTNSGAAAESPSRHGLSIVDGLAQAFEQFDKGKKSSMFGEKLGDDMKAAITAKQTEIRTTFSTLQNDLETERKRLNLSTSKTEAEIFQELATLSGGKLTADQVKKITEGQSLEVMTSIIESEMSKLKTAGPKAAAAAAEKAQGATPGAAATAAPTASAQETIVKIVLQGGDELTRYLASMIVGEATSVGVPVGGETIKLQIVGNSDKVTA
jgi:hypothetical protein